MIKKLWQLLLLGLIGAIAGIVLIAAIIPRLIGAVPLTVLSGSMEPTFSAGDLIVTKPVSDPADVQVGDIVTFQPVSDDPTLITHRVIDKQVSTAGLKFVTQGDANGGPDDAIEAEQIMGTHLYTVPYAGYLAQAVPRSVPSLMLPITGLLLVGYGAYTMTIGQRSRRRGESASPRCDSTESSTDETLPLRQSIKS